MRSGLRTILFMVAITVVFISPLGILNGLTIQRIRLNEQVSERRHVLDALGLMGEAGMSPEDVSRLFDDRVTAVRWPGKEAWIYVNRGPDGRPESLAFPVGGPGFWGPIQGFIGVTPDGHQITGIAFSRHSETPGLGARIEEEAFRRQFVGKALTLSKEGVILAFKPEGSELDDHSVHAITGATRTSAAVGLFLNAQIPGIEEVIAQGAVQELLRPK